MGSSVLSVYSVCVIAFIYFKIKSFILVVREIRLKKLNNLLKIILVLKKSGKVKIWLF